MSFVKSRYGGKGASNNIARDLMLIKSLLNVEDKRIYTLAGYQAVTNATSLVYGIGTVAQGSANNQRTGDTIKINRIDLIMGFSYTSGTAATTAMCNQIFNYYVVKYNKTPSVSGTVAFNISDFLNQDNNTQYTPASFPNSELAEDFTVLASGTVHVRLPIFTTANSQEIELVNLSIPCSYHQEYNGAANTTIVDNMTFVVVTALEPVNVGGTSTCLIQAVMWYIDN